MVTAAGTNVMFCVECAVSAAAGQGEGGRTRHLSTVRHASDAGCFLFFVLVVARSYCFRCRQLAVIALSVRCLKLKNY